MCAALVRTTMRAMAAIEIEHLHKSYGDVVAVDDVSLTVEPGEIFGIIGVNGAGKTTTVECVSGLTRPDRGRIERARPGPGRASATRSAAASASSCRRARCRTGSRSPRR